MAVLYTNHFVQFFDNNGDPLSNGKLFAYSAGTTTPKATYTTEEADIENAHPIVLDSSGRATVFIEGSYRFDLFDSNDVLIKSTDDVSSFSTLNESGDPFFESFSGDGSQTIFTLSESLGTDSKDIMVYVNDEGNDVGYDIQNPSAYTLSGTALTFSSAPPSGTDNVYVFAPTKLLGAAAASAGAAAASEAASSASAAASSASAAAAASLVITSTTAVVIGTGTKTFTVDAGLAISEGQWLIITSDANPSTNYMTGQITSYTSTTLEVNVTQAFGSGNLTDWTMKLSGVEGETGAAGPAGNIDNIGSQPTGTVALNDKFIFADVSDSDNSKNATIQDIVDFSPAFSSTDITGQDAATIATDDTFVFVDASDSDNLKKGTAQEIVDLVPADLAGKTDTTITASDKITFYDVSDGENAKTDTVQGIIDLASGSTSYGSVGTYAFCQLVTSTVSGGSTTAGSNLRYASIPLDGRTTVGTSGGTPSGTWRNMGNQALSGGATAAGVTLWVRIS